MNRYQRGQNFQQIMMPWEASFPVTNTTAHRHDKTKWRLAGRPCLLDRWLWAIGRFRGRLACPPHPSRGKTLSPSKDLAKQPIHKPTWAPFTSLRWRAQGTERGSLEDSRIGLNTVEACNQPWQINHPKSRPSGHVNPIEDIKIISLWLSCCLSAIKGPSTLQVGRHKNIFPLSLANFSSSQLTPL
jgi:hypothetical protein